MMFPQSFGEGDSFNHGYTESPAYSNFQQDDFEAQSRRISDLKCERVRLTTFCSWEYRDVQDPRELSKWGLFYKGPGDAVQCAFCHGVLKRWEKTDIPYNEHAKYFPRCRFIRGYDVGNIPIEPCTVYNSFTENNSTYNFGIVPGGVNSQIPQCNTSPTPVVNITPVPHYNVFNGDATLVPQQNVTRVPQTNVTNGDFQDYYKNETNRLNSFSRWPLGKNQTPAVLSAAGFYYKPTPEKADRVKCAYCAGKLFNWQVDDDPWIEHARCFPQCNYIQLCLGPEVVQDLRRGQQHQEPNGFQEEHVPANPPQTTTSSIVAMTETQTTGSNPQTTPSNPQTTPEDRVSARMTSEPVQAVLQMGFPEQTVKQTVEKFVRERPDHFPPAEELASILMEQEDQLSVETAEATPVMTPLQRLIARRGQGNGLAANPMTSSASGSDVTYQRTSPLQRSIASRIPGSDTRRETITTEESIVSPKDSDYKKKQEVNKDRIKSENSRLKDQFLCKICMESYVRVTFMPCGHLVCCAACSTTVTECPICRAQINGYVRTYF